MQELTNHSGCAWRVSDHVYRSSIRHEDIITDVEVLDTCSKVRSGRFLLQEGKKQG